MLFAVAALTLAGLGIYGVVAVATAQRTREIGLRLAMGAKPLDVVQMVVRGAMVLAGSGVVLGAVAALWTLQFLTSLLFGDRADRRHYTGRGLRPAVARRCIRGLAAGAARRPRRSARCASYRIGSRD